MRMSEAYVETAARHTEPTSTWNYGILGHVKARDSFSVSLTKNSIIARLEHPKHYKLLPAPYLAPSGPPPAPAHTAPHCRPPPSPLPPHPLPPPPFAIPAPGLSQIHKVLSFLISHERKRAEVGALASGIPDWPENRSLTSASTSKSRQTFWPHGATWVAQNIILPVQALGKRKCDMDYCSSVQEFFVCLTRAVCREELYFRFRVQHQN